MITTEIDEQVRETREKLRSVQQRHRDTKAQIDTLQHAIATGDAALIDQRAMQIVNRGDGDDERHDTLTVTFESNREQLRRLESEAKALALAEKQLFKALDLAEERATAQAAATLEAEIMKGVRELDTALSRAERLNEKLLALDARLRDSGLAQAGGKSLVLLSRTGAAWNALSPLPIHGTPIHILEWRRYMAGMLGD